jgi:hypothetical protein
MSHLTQIQKLAAAIKERGDEFVALVGEERAGREISRKGVAVAGEQDGLYRALALTPALTWADFRVKEAVVAEYHTADVGGYSAADLRDEIGAMLAASLLDDLHALLKTLASTGAR